MLGPEGVKAGRISKPYGLRGEVISILEPQSRINIEPGNPLFIDIDGQRVPFFVEEVEMLSRGQAILKFEFIDSLEEARKVAGCDIYFDKEQDPDSSFESEDLTRLIGYMATDKNTGLLGKISEYLPHPMNPVFVIQSEGRELIVPAIWDFIDQIYPKKQTVHFILPEGLTEL